MKYLKNTNAFHGLIGERMKKLQSLSFSVVLPSVMKNEIFRFKYDEYSIYKNVITEHFSHNFE